MIMRVGGYGEDDEREPRYVLVDTRLPNSDDDYEDGLTELEMLQMLAEKLGYDLVSSTDNPL